MFDLHFYYALLGVGLLALSTWVGMCTEEWDISAANCIIISLCHYC